MGHQDTRNPNTLCTGQGSNDKGDGYMKNRKKSLAKCDTCGIENKDVKTRYKNGTAGRGGGAPKVGTFCPEHQRGE